MAWGGGVSRVQAGEGSYLHQHKVPEHMNVPEIAQAEERGEKAAEQHPTCEVVPEGEPLPKNAAAERGGFVVNLCYLEALPSASWLPRGPTHSY